MIYLTLGWCGHEFYIFTRRAQFSTYLDVTDDVLVTNFPKCLQNNFLQIKNTNFCQAQL